MSTVKIMSMMALWKSIRHVLFRCHNQKHQMFCLAVNQGAGIKMPGILLLT